MTDQAPPRELNDADFRLQMPTSLRTAIDDRAKSLGISRNEWLRRVARWALNQPVTTTGSRQEQA